MRAKIDDALCSCYGCACFVAHHADDCALKVAVHSYLSWPCEEHGRDACPACNPCSCGVAVEETFVVGKHAFLWDPGGCLIPTRIGDRKISDLRALRASVLAKEEPWSPYP